jgi:simple sugar transport system ATP-binding protein
MSEDYVLEMRGVRKTFGPVVALDNVDLELKTGEIRGLLGGNGAGKTTLMNILYGLYKSDSGQILVDDQPYDIQSPEDAINGGIGMVHQQFLQINSFTVTENIVLGTRLKNRPTLKLATEKQRIRELSTHFGLPVDPDATIADLPMGIRQRVEILKALYRGVKILVLDEPTTNLTPQEVDALFESLRAMVNEGLSVIFITHKLREVLQVCDTITVLRHGRNGLTLDREDASEEAFIKGMVGDDLDVENSLIFARDLSEAAKQVGQKPVLRVQEVTVMEQDVPALTRCSLTVHEGEILGVAGVAGNGQLELVESILGLRTFVIGEITVDGSSVTQVGTGQLIRQGVAYIPEDRWVDGYLPSANVAQNLILGLQRKPPYSNGRFLNWRVIYGRSRALIDEFSIMTQGPDEIAGNLSGGNIQRVMLARAFSQPVRLLIAHNPTRGLDLPSIEFIFGRLLERKGQGMATLLISENMDELFLLSNRIMALCNGEVMGILEPDQFDKYLLGRMMTGVKQGE